MSGGFLRPPGLPTGADGLSLQGRFVGKRGQWIGLGLGGGRAVRKDAVQSVAELGRAGGLSRLDPPRRSSELGASPTDSIGAIGTGMIIFV